MTTQKKGSPSRELDISSKPLSVDARAEEAILRKQQMLVAKGETSMSLKLSDPSMTGLQMIAPYGKGAPRRVQS
jgi:hypothetical protein